MSNRKLIDEDALFHYTKRITGMEYIINFKQLMINRYSETNDPYEYRQRKFAAVIDANKNDENIASEIIYEAEKYIKNSKILCFCRNVTERKNFYPAYQKTRMWSQYGDDHRGFCFVFSKEKLIQTMKNNYDNVTYGNVSYLRDKENVNLDFKDVFVENKRVDKEISDYIIKYCRRYKEDIFLKKYIDYRDEDEFRTIIIEKDDKNKFLDIRKVRRFWLIGGRRHQIKPTEMK